MKRKRTALRRAPRPAPRAPNADLLLEIGTEELPADYLPGLIAQLKSEAQQRLAQAHLQAGRIETFGTPRRLSLIARRLDALQRIPAGEIRGPAARAAYDASGKPTPALLGFLRSRGGAPDQVKLVSVEGKGEYVYLVMPATTRPARHVLPALLTELIAALRAPKMMRWDESGMRFARPIRWLAARYGTRLIRARAGRLAAGPATRVGGPRAPRSVPVASAAAYLRALKRCGILLDHGRRRDRIKRLVARAAALAGGRPVPEAAAHGLIDEVTHLTERPVAMLGRFDPAFLELPRDVLLASMAKHQRVVAIEDRRGSPVPAFVGILDGTPGRPGDVRITVEKILNARLADSLLFWNQDRAVPLREMAARLSGVTFHEQLGSMAEKTERLTALSRTLAEAWQLAREESDQLDQACGMAKADLASTMVREFPTLQGVMGRAYARAAGEPAAVADAIGEQYLPAGGRAPDTLIGRALALLDKYDTLTGYFGIGKEPTGDQDPFGLRRAAQGIVEIAWLTGRPLPLDALFAARSRMRPFEGLDEARTADIGRRVHTYLLERLYTFAWPAREGERAHRAAPSADCIDAVIRNGPRHDLADAMTRIRMLQDLYRDPDLLKAAKVIERTANILKAAPVALGPVEAARLDAPEERALWDVFEAERGAFAALADGRRYGEATRRFGRAFHRVLHEFFARVLVNVPDEPVRRNRLSLLKAIHALYTDRVADLSKLSIVQHEEPVS
ncbi:MAG TPA: glycine--tRNA ligase subunit beta [bacterium]